MDNRSENSEAALAAVRLASRRGVRAIIGPTTSGGVKAVLSAECGVPLIVPSATADDLAPKGKQNTMIRLCFTDSAQANFLARFAIAQGYKKAALLTEASSDYSRGMSASFTKDFTSLGGTVTAEEYYRSGECDFYSVLSRLAQKDFDALFLPGYYSEAALIIRQLHELGINAAILSGDAFDVPELCALVGEKDYLNDIYFTDHYTPQESEASAFSQKYYSAYGEYPPAYAALGYDSLMMIAEAIVVHKYAWCHRKIPKFVFPQHIYDSLSTKQRSRYHILCMIEIRCFPLDRKNRMPSSCYGKPAVSWYCLPVFVLYNDIIRLPTS